MPSSHWRDDAWLACLPRARFSSSSPEAGVNEINEARRHARPVIGPSRGGGLGGVVGARRNALLAYHELPDSEISVGTCHPADPIEVEVERPQALGANVRHLDRQQHVAVVHDGGTAQQLAVCHPLDAFARSDHYLFPRFEAAHATDAFATLAGLARETADIDLCVLVSPVTFRHPGVIAKTAATIDEMSGGRLRLGVGTGWMQEEHDAFGLAFYDQAERFNRLEETLGYLRAAFAVEKTGFDGSHYALEAIDALPGPTGPLPIIVGGGGRVRTPTLAGRFADEFNLAPMGHTKIVERIATARKAATDAGRDPRRSRSA